MKTVKSAKNMRKIPKNSGLDLAHRTFHVSFLYYSTNTSKLLVLNFLRWLLAGTSRTGQSRGLKTAHGEHPVKTQNRSADKAHSHLSARESKPTAHADVKAASPLRLLNGRIVSKTLADPDLKAQVKSAEKRMFPNRDAFVKEMHRRGVLTATGRLSKNYGG